MNIIKNLDYKTFFKKALSLVLAIVCILSLVESTIEYSSADISSSFGTNKALGSPVLNSSATSDDWNKYEIITWGIFLSNFTKPFIDDYESAFNKASSYGSQGSGTKALTFANGSDISTSDLIQDLTTYAINYHNNSLKPIYVSYNHYQGTNKISENVFDGTIESTEDNSARLATLRDLFMGYSESGDNNTDTILADEGLYSISGQSAGSDYEPDETSLTFQYDATDMYETDTYLNMSLPLNMYLPTFGLSASSGAKIILDYRDTYDIQIFSAALSAALTSDYADIAGEMLSASSVFNSKLYLDGFGNICVYYGGRYITVIPASANQHITSEDSKNLINSLIFNTGTSATNEFNMMTTAGAENSTSTIWSKMWKKNRMLSGTAAFTNESYQTKSGGIALFYDTDTLVLNKLKESIMDTDEYTSSKLSIDTGDIYKELFESSILDNNEIPLKIEAINVGDDLLSSIKNEKVQELVYLAINSTSGIVDVLSTFSDEMKEQNSVPMLTTLKSYQTDDNIDLFSDDDAYIVAVSAGPGSKKSSNTKTSYTVFRMIPNYAYKMYRSTDSSDLLAKENVNRALNGETPLSVFDSLIMTDKKFSDFSKSFVTAFSGTLYSIKDSSKLSSVSAPSIGGTSYNLITLNKVSDESDIKNEVIAPLCETESASGFWIFKNTDNEYSAKELFTRSVKVYKTSSVLECVANILSIRDGSDFAVYASNIYLTYLDWYGIEKDSLTGAFSSNFDAEVISDSSIPESIDDITDEVPSKEDRDEATKEYAYLMLHPTAGQTYRNQIILSNMQTFVYDQYQKIVYGDSSSYNYGLVTTRNNSGFLQIDNYSENFLTSWVMEHYVDVAMALIGVGVVLMILIGVLNKRKLSWYLASVVLIVGVVLFVPTSGEIVPYLGNNTVQSLFKDKMTYWSISEQCGNSAVEESVSSGITGTSAFGDLDENDQQQVLALTKSVNSLYLDRYLSIKQDISNKVTQADNADWDKYQELKSVRWMLPIILRQFSGDDGTADYVYVTLSDKLTDMENMYWYYKPLDALTSKSTTSNNSDITIRYGTETGVDGEGNADTLYNHTVTHSSDSTLKNETTGIVSEAGSLRAWGAYTKLSEKTAVSGVERDEYRCISYTRNPDNSLNKYFYLIDRDGAVPNIKLTSCDLTTSRGTYIKEYAGKVVASAETNLSTWQNISNEIQAFGPNYSRYDRNSMHQIYGYLWNTESPLTYFYATAKDSFSADSSFATIMNDIQGVYVTNDEGKRYRKTFMNSDVTGTTRDILDLENMFNNVIPYMFEVQLIAGGDDDVSGVFKDDIISDYSIYNTNYVSWLFRCNWVSKIMDGEYSKSGSICYYDASGNRIKTTVSNMLLPDAYIEAGREMVFSRAQADIMGLGDDDLSLVELLCVQLNEDVKEDWELLLNYVSEEGISKDIILRQMAIEATLEFCEAFSPSTSLTGSNQLYPNSLDLRSISFDSIMTMLMINVTHDSSFIYGDTMNTIVCDYDTFTALMLLLDALICSTIIPFIRNVILALIFYLGFVAIAATLFKSNKDKTNTSIGYMTCNLLVLAINIIYFLVFKFMVNMTSSDDVLTLKSIEINAGNPLWCFIIILIVSILYLWANIKVADIVVNNYKDMGYQIYKGAAELVIGNISSGIERLHDKVAEAAASGGESASSGGGKDAKSYDDVSSGESTNQTSGSGRKSKKSKSKFNDNLDSDMDTDVDYYDSEDQYNYSSGKADEHRDDGSDSIDDKIDRGSKKQKEAKKKEKSDYDDSDMDTSELDPYM